MASPFHDVTTLSSRAGCGRPVAVLQQQVSRVAATTEGRPGRRAAGGSSCRARRCRRSVTRSSCGRGSAVLVTEHLDELRRRPGVGQALDAVGVGVEGRREAALGGAEVAHQEVGRLGSHPPGQRRRRWPGSSGRRRAAAGRCRRASSRSGARPSARRRSTARSRRPAGRRCHRGPSPRRSVAPWPGRPRSRSGRDAAAGTRAPSTAGTSARRRTRRGRRRTGRRKVSTACAEGGLVDRLRCRADARPDGAGRRCGRRCPARAPAGWSRPRGPAPAPAGTAALGK